MQFCFCLHGRAQKILFNSITAYRCLLHNRSISKIELEANKRISPSLSFSTSPSLSHSLSKLQCSCRGRGNVDCGITVNAKRSKVKEVIKLFLAKAKPRGRSIRCNAPSYKAAQQQRSPKRSSALDKVLNAATEASREGVGREKKARAGQKAT